MAVRLMHTPAQTFAPDFTWEDTNIVIISLIESNLAIISAAYPSVRSFLNKVRIGFLVPETVKDSKSGSKGGGSWGLQTTGKSENRKFGSRVGDSVMTLGDTTIGHHAVTVRGDTKSDKSFGSEVIMVRTPAQC